MFKVAKLEKVDNEKVSINLVTQERNKYENGKVVLSETFKTLSFDISGGNYSFSFNLNSKLEDLLEIPMNETLEEDTSENVKEMINDKKIELQQESFEEAGFRETTVEGLDDDSSIGVDE